MSPSNVFLAVPLYDGKIDAGTARSVWSSASQVHKVVIHPQGNSLLAANFNKAREYDPRNPDEGVEVGADHGSWFGRAAVTNGASTPLGPTPNRAQTVSAKLGSNFSRLQTAASFYDDFHFATVFFGGEEPVRATRWGAYALGHAGQASLLGEVGAGTDRTGSQKVNSMAYILEADYQLTRGVNVRARYDHLDLYRDDTVLPINLTESVTLRDLNTHDRYALEGEFTPVPFAELRWALRYINHKADEFPDSTPIHDERQAFVQFHFSY